MLPAGRPVNDNINGVVEEQDGEAQFNDVPDENIRLDWHPAADNL